MTAYTWSLLLRGLTLNAKLQNTRTKFRTCIVSDADDGGHNKKEEWVPGYWSKRFP